VPGIDADVEEVVAGQDRSSDDASGNETGLAPSPSNESDSATSRAPRVDPPEASDPGTAEING
jgi:hypothetical protein